MKANLVWNGGYVYAIEPSPSNVDMLRKNISLNNYDGIAEGFSDGRIKQSRQREVLYFWNVQFRWHMAEELETKKLHLFFLIRSLNIGGVEC